MCCETRYGIRIPPGDSFYIWFCINSGFSNLCLYGTFTSIQIEQSGELLPRLFTLIRQPADGIFSATLSFCCCRFWFLRRISPMMFGLSSSLRRQLSHSSRKYLFKFIHSKLKFCHKLHTQRSSSFCELQQFSVAEYTRNSPRNYHLLKERSPFLLWHFSLSHTYPEHSC